jgi:hypothetical protein
MSCLPRGIASGIGGVVGYYSLRVKSTPSRAFSHLLRRPLNRDSVLHFIAHRSVIEDAAIEHALFACGH